MHATVIVPTNRIGGFDVVCESLSRQIVWSFDVVIVDSLHERRAPIVDEILETYPFEITHIPPKPGGVFLSDYCRALNTGLEIARGDVVILQPDYCSLDPDCVHRHLELHREHPGDEVGFMLDYHSLTLPPVDPDLVGYSPEVLFPDTRESVSSDYADMVNKACDLYEADYRAGHLDDFMWSIFRDPVTHPGQLSLLSHEFTHCHDPRKVEFNPQFCSLKNESFKTIFLQDTILGFDEDFDGSHLYQDTAFSARFVQKGGDWRTEPGGEMRIVNPRKILRAKRMIRPFESNRALLDTKGLRL